MVSFRLQFSLELDSFRETDSTRVGTSKRESALLCQPNDGLRRVGDVCDDEEAPEAWREGRPFKP